MSDADAANAGKQLLVDELNRLTGENVTMVTDVIGDAWLIGYARGQRWKARLPR